MERVERSVSSSRIRTSVGPEMEQRTRRGPKEKEEEASERERVPSWQERGRRAVGDVLRAEEEEEGAEADIEGAIVAELCDR